MTKTAQPATQPLRTRPEYTKLKDAAENQLGTIGIVRLGLCQPADTPDTTLDLTANALDYLAHAFGPIQRIYGLSRDAGPLHYTLLTGKFQSGAIFHLEFSKAEAPGVSYDYYEVAGSNGLLDYDSRREPLFLLETHTGATENTLPHTDTPATHQLSAETLDLARRVLDSITHGQVLTL